MKPKPPIKESPEMRKARVAACLPQRPKHWSGSGKEVAPDAIRRKTKKILKDLH